MSTLNPDYATLASRIIVSNHQKNTYTHFSTVMEQLYNFRDVHGALYPLVSDNLWNFTKQYKEEIDNNWSIGNLFVYENQLYKITSTLLPDGIDLGGGHYAIGVYFDNETYFVQER
jgi:hypothetical protein